MGTTGQHNSSRCWTDLTTTVTGLLWNLRRLYEQQEQISTGGRGLSRVATNAMSMRHSMICKWTT